MNLINDFKNTNATLLAAYASLLIFSLGKHRDLSAIYQFFLKT